MLHETNLTSFWSDLFFRELPVKRPPNKWHQACQKFKTFSLELYDILRLHLTLLLLKMKIKLVSSIVLWVNIPFNCRIIMQFFKSK